MDAASISATGDVNADGEVDVGDMVLVNQHILGAITLDTGQSARADLYPAGGGDGVVDLSDLLLLQQAVLGP